MSSLLEKTLKEKKALVEGHPLKSHPSNESFNVVDLNRQNSSPHLAGLEGNAIPTQELARTVGVMSSHSQITVRRVQSEDVVEFSGLVDLEDVHSIKELCRKNVPEWEKFEISDLQVRQLCEGLSNASYAVSLSLDSPNKCAARVSHSCVLFRVYGAQVSRMYDPETELKIFRALASYRIAPQIIGNGEGWRIEEWHYAVPLPCALMNNPSVLCQVAAGIGRMHKLHQRQDFPPASEIPREPALQLRVQKWGKLALEMAQGDLSSNPTVQAMKLDQIFPEEADWLPGWLLSHDTGITGQGLDLVFAHNDLQENNLLQTQYGLRMIDFEYSYFNYQAADLANFFCEFTLDYISQTHHPFYRVNKSAYPTEEEQRLFCAVYLSEYLETPILPSDDAYIVPLLQNIERFTLVSHLLWALWSVNRASPTMLYNEFDFIHYGKYRLDCYLRTKADILARAEASDPQPTPPSRAQPQHKEPPQPASNESTMEVAPAVPAARVSTGITGVQGALLGIAGTAAVAAAFVLGSRLTIARR